MTSAKIECPLHLSICNNTQQIHCLLTAPYFFRQGFRSDPNLQGSQPFSSESRALLRDPSAKAMGSMFWMGHCETIPGNPLKKNWCLAIDTCRKNIHLQIHNEKPQSTIGPVFFNVKTWGTALNPPPTGASGRPGKLQNGCNPWNIVKAFIWKPIENQFNTSITCFLMCFLGDSKNTWHPSIPFAPAICYLTPTLRRSVDSLDASWSGPVSPVDAVLTVKSPSQQAPTCCPTQWPCPHSSGAPEDLREFVSHARPVRGSRWG